MKTNIFYLFALVLTSCQGQNTLSTNSTKAMDSTTKYNDLTPQQEQVLVNKATDRPYTGDYYGKKDNGLYICRRCNNPLYTSEDKFDSHCGWPSFDDEIKGSVTRILDADGRRTEIVCNNCQGHLGHVFLGEQMTDKNTRHCVNTSSILFVPKDKTKELPAVIK
jgi:methionine-R-sulfoxide reductase